jgi:putative restriction endonuclease
MDRLVLCQGTKERRATMAGWVGALAKGSESNWQICKTTGLWGTGSASGCRVTAGDELFVWLSGEGWLAHCVATTDGRAPASITEVPWPAPERYRYLFGIRVVAETSLPSFMSASTLMRKTGLHTIRLGQFPRVDDEQALEALRAATAR